MKNLLTSLCVLASLVVPSSTFAESYKPNSHDSMLCMKLRQCKDGVNELVVNDYTGETKDILISLDRLGIKVYEASSEYFIDEYRALYYPDKNTIFLNKKYLTDEKILLELLRHEGWHVAQDCMAGTLSNSELVPIIKPEDIPESITEEAIERYGRDPTTIRIEREAILATDIFRMTSDALVVCDSEYPMWVIYDPPERTRSWLYTNGFL